MNSTPFLDMLVLVSAVTAFVFDMMTSSNGNIFRVTGHLCEPVNSPHKGQWRAAFLFSLICAWINRWVNNREAGYLRRYCTHYDVIVMEMTCIEANFRDWTSCARSCCKKMPFSGWSTESKLSPLSSCVYFWIGAGGFLSIMYNLQIAFKMFRKINVLCLLKSFKYECTPKTTVHILTHCINMISILAA